MYVDYLFIQHQSKCFNTNSYTEITGISQYNSVRPFVSRALSVLKVVKHKKHRPIYTYDYV